MKKVPIALFLFLFAFTISSFIKKQPRVLVFSKTMGYHHANIADGIIAIEKLGKDNNFSIDSTTDASLFTDHNLKKYKAIIFLSTTGDVLNEQEQQALENYIHNGGGYVGIHAATDTEFDWPWYNKLVGAYFKSHPKQQNATVLLQDSIFIATNHLPKEWKRFDEWYNFKSLQLADAHILLTLDESTYQGGENGQFHPVSWYHDFEGGRAFYTALGHTKESFSDPLFLTHLLGGIQYAMGIK